MSTERYKKDYINQFSDRDSNHTCCPPVLWSTQSISLSDWVIFSELLWWIHTDTTFCGAWLVERSKLFSNQRHCPKLNCGKLYSCHRVVSYTLLFTDTYFTVSSWWITSNNFKCTNNIFSVSKKVQYCCFICSCIWTY